MCFADDLLLFTKGDPGSVKCLITAFNKFSVASGLKANQLKSCIYFGGVSERNMEAILDISGMVKGELPFKYLGVPLSTKKLTIMQCQPLVSKMLARVECWSAKILSYGGRLQLIKSVLLSIQNYWSQIFLLPQKILKQIITICRTFLWTGKASFSRRALVSWDNLCLPKTAGGWNVTNIQIWNRAALCKLLWNVENKKDKLWVRWIHAYYMKGRPVEMMDIPSQSSWIIQKIIGARKYLINEAVGREVMNKQIFSIHKMYVALRGNFPKVEWHKMLSQNAAPAKCIFITWLAIMNRLATVERLTKFGISVDQNCVLCRRKTETLHHLFFDCTFAAELVVRLKMWSGIGGAAKSWDQELLYMKTQCHSKTRKQCMYRIVISVAVYCVWKERNLRRFQGRNEELESLIQYGKLLIYSSCQKKPLLVAMLR